MKADGSLSGGELEELALLRAWCFAAPNALHADAHSPDRAIELDLQALQIWAETPLALAGHLAADAAQVFRLAASRVEIAANRLFAANRTLHAHNASSPSAEERKNRQSSNRRETSV